MTGLRGRTVADLPTGRVLEVVAAGSGFVVHRGGRPTWLLAADGAIRGLDPRSATYHRVPTPPGFRPLEQHDPRLRG